MSLNQLKVSTRLTLGISASVSLGVLIAVTSMVEMHSLAGMVDELANQRMPNVDRFTDYKDNLNAIARASRNIIIVSDPVVRATESRAIHDLQAGNTEILKELDKALTQPRERDLLKAISETRRGYNDAVDRAINLGIGGKTEEAGRLLIGEAGEKQNLLFMAVDESTKLQADAATHLAAESAELAATSATVMLAMAGAMGLFGGLMAWALARNLKQALGAEPAALSVAVQRMADGDLETAVVLHLGDDTSIMAAVARMRKSLIGIVTDVRGNSESVAAASAEIAQGNLDLSSRTEGQASSLEETAASMEQISAAAKHNADSAAQASQLALNANAMARDGAAVVGDVVQTMNQIDQASREIVHIIGVIDGIAFQTNILALNAAVEAARVGEQGRGFAVVAGEVRALARRSAEAAKQIKNLINTSVERVEQGTALVGKAGLTMASLVGAIQRVNDIVGEIASGSREQMAGVGQVSEAVSQMDRTTQQNAALVEESAAAADSLRQQAQLLVIAVAVFRLAGDRVTTRGAGVTPMAHRANLS